MPDDDFVLILTARNQWEARLVYGILEGEGLIVWMPGAMLGDEWATGMQSSGLLATEVYVAKQHVERAHEILAEFRAGSQELSEGMQSDGLEP